MLNQSKIILFKADLLELKPSSPSIQSLRITSKVTEVGSIISQDKPQLGRHSTSSCK